MTKAIETIIVKLEYDKELLTVGQLEMIDHRIYFEYTPEFIATGIELSPYNLPLKAGVHTNQLEYFNGLPGVFHDALPDGWGLLLMDRFFGSHHYNFYDVTPLQRLAYIGENAMGALTFHPCMNKSINTKLLDLNLLARESKKIIEGHAETILPELYIAGGSPAGARPKIVVGYNETTNQMIFDSNHLPNGYESYLIKFFAKTESAEAALIEYAYAKMAKLAGMTIPQVKLFESQTGEVYFGIKRFDREHSTKIHMHSLCGLINAPHNIPCFEYIDFIKLTFALTKSEKAKLAAFKLMVFNVLAHNKDDHTKNISYLYKNHQWVLAPCYDLTFSEGMGQQHAMTIAGKGKNITTEDLLTVAKKTDIPNDIALGIIKDVKQAVSQWPIIAKELGVAGRVIKKIQQSN